MKSTNALPLRFGRPLAAVALAALALLSLLVTLVLAQTEIPSSTSAAFIQTSGPNATLGTGDWYTNIGQGNHPHNFKIFVPCTIAPSQVLTLELFDPEVFTGTQAIDEIRGAPDDTTFQLLAPDNTVLATTTYPPSDATNDRWNLFTTFTVGGSGCGIYTLLASTSDNDDNAWRLRITHPDQVPGSGDEPTVAAFETSFQHAGPPDTLTCQSFYFFVPQTPSIRLNNFDLDFGVPGYTPVPTVDYYPPSGASPSSTASGNAVWNNGTASTRVGDVINNPQWGWWRAQICVGPGNQYIFEPEGLSYVLEEPPTPDMTLSKDDGLTDVQPGQIITYTIPYANQGAGAALDTTLTDFLPPQTTFVACSGGLDCALAGPGVVTYSLGTVPTGGSGQVTLTVQVDPGAPPAAVLTNTARLEYEDVMFNVYPPKEATDVDTVAANVDLQINKTDGGVTTVPGGVVVYTLAYTNVGTVAATGVVITETVPANTTFNAAASAPTPWSCADGSGPGTICTTSLGSVALNTPGSVAFAVTVDDPFPPDVTQIANTASIGDDGANGPDPTPDDNTSTDTTPVQVTSIGVDLQINKTDGGVTTVPGGVVVYTLAYTNVGTVAATGVVITETVPANTTFNAAASAPTPWSCADGSGPGTICTTSLGSVALNTPGSVAFAVTVDDPFPPDVYQIANTASIGDDGANGPDPTPDDNTSSDTTPVQATPVGVDLQINKTDGGITTAPGDVVAYTLTYANVGGVTATGVVITETVPANTTFNAAASAPTTWDCADGSGPGTICTTLVDSLAPNDGGTATFALTVDNPLPSGVTQIANTASIGDDGASGPDPTPQNNVSSDTTPVNVPVPAPTSNPPSEKKKKTHAAEAEPTATPVMAPPAAPAPPPTATPAVLFLPETGEGGPPADVRWPLALLVPGLLAGVGWAVYRRRV